MLWGVVRGMKDVDIVVDVDPGNLRTDSRDPLEQDRLLA